MTSRHVTLAGLGASVLLWSLSTSLGGASPPGVDSSSLSAAPHNETTIKVDPSRNIMEARDRFDAVVWHRALQGDGTGKSPSLGLPGDRAQPARQGRDNFVLIATLPKGDSNIWEGDVDHDGAKELWYAYGGAVHVWEATGNNTFTHVHSAPAPASDMCWFLGIGDTDNDGLQEIIWKAGYAGDPYLVFCEQPNPFTYPSVPTAEHHTGVENTHYNHLRVFDMDTDAVNDVICSHQGTSERSVAVYEAYADNLYREVYGVHFSLGYSVSGCVGVGDFDGDRNLEIVAPEASNGVRAHVIECRGNNEYEETWTSDWFSDLNGYWATEGGDLDRDGLGDFVIVTGRGGFTEPTVWTAWMFETVGNNQYQPVWNYECTGGAMGFDGGAVSGDATGDGYPDLLFQAGSSHTILFTGAANNMLEPIWSLDGPVAGQGRYRLITSDLDLDEEPEMVWYTDSATVVYEHVPGIQACTYSVCPDGSGDFVKIQDAIDAASNGDVICLCDATFVGDGNRDIDFLGKAISVRSASANPARCIINAEGSAGDKHRAFYFHCGEYLTSVVEKITIVNGLAENGGGIACTNNSSPTITGCVISGNKATHDGGGVYTSLGIDIRHCTISGNWAGHYGGGLFGGCNPWRSIFWGNSADGGEGPDFYANFGGCANLEDDECLGLWNCFGSGVDGLSDVLCNCMKGVKSLERERFLCEPLFCQPEPWQSAPTAAGNYFLRAGSPCIDQQGSGLIGALGVQCQACCLPPPSPTCLDTDLYDCIQRGGSSLGPGHLCTGGEGACCLDGGFCEMMEPLCCQMLGGLSQGLGSDCAAMVCLEACCHGDGTCLDLPPDQCLPDGLPQGARSQCLGDGDSNGIDDACEGFEACCLPDGTCLNVRPNDCPFGGSLMGPGSRCVGDASGDGIDDACQDLQACCLPDGDCIEVGAPACWPTGIPQGPHSHCLGDLNGNGVDNGCEASDECLDQACEDADGATRNIYYFMPMGQEFVPATSAHEGVEVLIDDFNPGGPQVPLMVKIHEGTIGGPVVPGSQVQTIPTGGGWVRFHFAQTLYLEPGATYVLEVSVTASRWAWPSAGGLCYPLGTGYLSGSPSSEDNCFRTWVMCLDCNANGVADGQDIAEGTSRDCDGSWIPDECDPEYGDVSLFVSQLLAETPEPVWVCMFDQNSDGILNGGDIQGFVNRLLSGG